MSGTETVKKMGKKQGHRLTGPGPGRPKGVPNKLSRTAKENIEAVYAGLGGVKGQIGFLKAHPKVLADFYTNVYPRLIPLDVSHSGELKSTVTFIMPRPSGNGEGKK